MEAPNGETARKLIREATPDLILLDLMLPGINGLDLCKILKKDEATRSIPIVMLTAKSSEADIVAGLEMGAEDYVVKAFQSSGTISSNSNRPPQESNIYPRA